MKDTFSGAAAEGGLSPAVWSLVQGGSVADGCAPVVSGRSLVFSGPGLRQATTVDLDLRNARFVVFVSRPSARGGVWERREECTQRTWVTVVGKQSKEPRTRL